MMFVPCVEGISHSPREQASPLDIALAADLAGTVNAAGKRTAAPERWLEPEGGTVRAGVGRGLEVISEELDRLSVSHGVAVVLHQAHVLQPTR